MSRVVPLPRDFGSRSDEEQEQLIEAALAAMAEPPAPPSPPPPTPDIPQLKPGSNACICTSCQLLFKSVNGFDAHRRGSMDNRRCLTEVELAMKGMTKNDKGQWVFPRFSEEEAE